MPTVLARRGMISAFNKYESQYLSIYLGCLVIFVQIVSKIFTVLQYYFIYCNAFSALCNPQKCVNIYDCAPTTKLTLGIFVSGWQLTVVVMINYGVTYLHLFYIHLFTMLSAERDRPNSGVANQTRQLHRAMCDQDHTLTQLEL